MNLRKRGTYDGTNLLHMSAMLTVQKKLQFFRLLEIRGFGQQLNRRGVGGGFNVR